MADDVDDFKMDFVEVRVPDLMNLIEVVNLVLGKQQAEDIAKCHNNLVDIRYSPLTKELEAARDRFDGLLQDYWADRGRAQAQMAMEAPESDEEEELPDLPAAVPLGTLKGHRAPAMTFEMDEGDE